MNTPNIGNPETDPGPRRGDVYTPIDPLSDYDDIADDVHVDPSLQDLDEDETGNPSEIPEQPAYDGDISDQTPGHHRADRDFEYDDEDVDEVAR